MGDEPLVGEDSLASVNLAIPITVTDRMGLIVYFA